MAESPAATKQTRSLRSGFIAAVVVGAVSLVVSAWSAGDDPGPLYYVFSVSVPLIAMVAYGYFGYFLRQDQSQQFADSVYFLGFIFTLLALVTSMALLVSDDPTASVGPFLARFGVALITTLVGLVARIVILNFRETGDEALTRAQAALTKATNRFQTRLEEQANRIRINDESHALRVRKHHDALDMLLSEQIERAERTLKYVSETATSSAKTSAEQLHTTLEKVGDEVSADLKRIVNDATASLADASVRSGEILTRSSEAVEAGFRTVTEQVQLSATSYVKASGKNTEAIDQAMGELATTLQSHTRTLTAGLNSHKEVLALTVQAQSEVARGCGDLVESFGGLKTDLAGVTTALQGVGDAGAHFVTLNQQMAGLADQLKAVVKQCQDNETTFGAHRETLQASILSMKRDLDAVQQLKVSLTEQVSASGDAVRATQKQLTEAVHYLQKELDGRDS